MTFDVRFRQPSNILISGPSQSGKSNFIYKLLTYKNLLINPKPKTVIYVYSGQHPLVEKLVNQGMVDKVLKNLPENYETLEKLISNHRHHGSILVIDDALYHLRPYLPKVFEVLSNRENCTVIFVTQNTFVDSPNYRRISDNCHYAVMMKHARNSMKIRNFAMQIDNCNSKYIMDAYKDAVRLKKPLDETKPPIYGYLVLDLRPFSPEITRVRSSIFPDEKELISVYTENEDN